MAAERDEEPSTHGRKVLLVDDEPDILDSLQRLIEVTLGATVSTATSGAAALELLASDRFDVILSDYKMPDMDGMEFLANARRRSPEIIRLMMTAYAEEHLAVRARNEAGVTRFLSKPLDSAQVIHVLREILTRLKVPPTTRPPTESPWTVRNVSDLVVVLARMGSLPGIRSTYLLDLSGVLLAQRGRGDGGEGWRTMLMKLHATAEAWARTRGRVGINRLVLDLGAMQVAVHPVEGDMLLVVESDSTVDPARLLETITRACRELHEVSVGR